MLISISIANKRVHTIGNIFHFFVVFIYLFFDVTKLVQNYLTPIGVKAFFITNAMAMTHVCVARDEMGIETYILKKANMNIGV